MSLVSNKWIKRKYGEAGAVHAESLAFDASISIKQAIEALNAPGFVTEYHELVAANVTAKAIQLTGVPANPQACLVSVCHGIVQQHSVDFVVSSDDPAYVGWAGLSLENQLNVGDIIIVSYEKKNQIIGTFETSEDVQDSSGVGYGVAVNVSEDYDMIEAQIVLVDTSIEDVSITLPPCADNITNPIVIKKLSGDHDVYIFPYGADMIDNDSEIVILEQFKSYTFIKTHVNTYSVI